MTFNIRHESEIRLEKVTATISQHLHISRYTMKPNIFLISREAAGSAGQICYIKAL